MSLISSIQMAGNSLQAEQIGLQVAGQNIANASTPGYIREEAEFAPAPTQRQGSLLLGSGVLVTGIKQDIDNFLNERLRSATSDASGTALDTQTYQQVENLLGTLNDTNLDSSLTDFVSSIAQVLNQPEDATVRNLAVLKGQTLTGAVNSMATQANQLRSDLNDQVVQDASTINNLIGQVRDLNVQIAESQGGAEGGNQAVGLSDQREQALTSLSNLMNITTQNQPDGTVSVFSGGDYLVDGGQMRQVKVDESTDRGLTIANIRLAQGDAPLAITSGQVGGLINSRDNILGGFIDQLNSFAGTLASEFNKVYSTGQGLNGYTQVTSTSSVDNANAPLDATGLKVTPTTGTFQVQVFNTKTGLTQTTDIHVVEDGLGNDTSLADLASSLNSISGLSAATTADGRLTINTNSSDEQVAFGGDTSGTLAALGINTFFTGSDAFSIGVNKTVMQDPSTFAASSGGVGVDTNVAQQLAGFLDQPLQSANGLTISNIYDQMAADVTQSSAVAKSANDSAQTFQQSLVGQQAAISGVSIDEETINMLNYQRNFQASAKYISTLNDLLGDLVQL